MDKTLKPDFLVVGAGFAGCLLAKKLKAKGYSVCLVEKESAARQLFKGELLQPRSVQILQDAGLGSVLEKGNAIQGFNFRDLAQANSSVRSHGKIDYPKDNVATSIPHHLLISGLRGELQKDLGEMFFEGAQLEAINQESPDFLQQPRFNLTSSGGTKLIVEAKIVLGCDGRRSTVRQWAQGAKAVKKAQTVLGAPSEFIVGCEIENTLKDSSCYQIIRSDRDSTLSIFAVSKKHCRVYWNAPNKAGFSLEKFRSRQDLWIEKLNTLFADINKSTELSLSPPQKTAASPAFSSWLGPASRGAFFLVGDSLAVTTPFGGQGMTCAALHACAIEELFAFSIPSNRSTLASVGRRYESRALAYFSHFTLLNTGLYHLFFNRNKTLKGLTQYILNKWEDEPELGERMGRLFGGIELDTPELGEIIKLWGVPLPAKFPITQSPLQLQPQKLLPSLMALSNNAVTRLEGATTPYLTIKQRVHSVSQIASKPAKKLLKRMNHLPLFNKRECIKNLTQF